MPGLRSPVCPVKVRDAYTLVAADYCLHGVLLALRQGRDLERAPLLRSGQREQLKRSAKASAATTLDRTLTQHTTFVRSVT